MRAVFLDEAARKQVLPLDDRYVERGLPQNRPDMNEGRTTFVYHPGITRITESAAPNMKNGSYSIEGRVVMPEGGAAGIIVMMVGAADYHIRARDRFETLPSVVVIGVAALYLVALSAG